MATCYPLLSRLAVVQVLASLSAGATGGLLVVLADDWMGVGASGFGFLLAAIGSAPRSARWCCGRGSARPTGGGCSAPTCCAAAST